MIQPSYIHARLARISHDCRRLAVDLSPVATDLVEALASGRLSSSDQLGIERQLVCLISQINSLWASAASLQLLAGSSPSDPAPALHRAAPAALVHGAGICTVSSVESVKP